MNKDTNAKVVCCTHPHTAHCKGCTMSLQCDGNTEQLVSGCYSPNSEQCKTCLIKDYCTKTPPIIHRVNKGEILHPVENKNK